MQQLDEAELERRNKAKLELARRLAEVLQFAVLAEMTNEAALIARLIEATLNAQTIDLLTKLYH